MDIKQTVMEMRSLLPKNFVHEQIKIIEGGSDNHKKANKVVKWLSRYGFEEIRLGTNILTMKHKQYKDVVYKIALDDEGQKDGIRDKWYSTMIPEYVEVYYVAPQGVYSIQQRVRNFRDKEHFMEYIEEVLRIQESLIDDYDMLLVDMSLKTFLNYGLDQNDRVRILDGSDMIQLEGFVPRCNRKVMKKNPIEGERPFKTCNGKLKYDENFHYLVCKSCKSKVLPIEIAQSIKEEVKIRKMKLNHGFSPEQLKLIELRYAKGGNVDFIDFNEKVETHDEALVNQVSDEDGEESDLITPFEDSLDDKESVLEEDDSDEDDDTSPEDEYGESDPEDDDDDEEPSSRVELFYKLDNADDDPETPTPIDSFVEPDDREEIGEHVLSSAKLNTAPINGYDVHFYMNTETNKPVIAVVPIDARFRSSKSFDQEVIAAITEALDSVKKIYVSRIDDDDDIEEYLEIKK